MLEKMKSFIMVVEKKGFRIASNELNISPGMVSKRIEKLEQELNIKLFKRNQRTITLTDDGEVFYNKCKKILNDLESCIRETRNNNKDINGVLKIGIPHAINHIHVLPNISKLLGAHHELKFEIVTGNHGQEIFSHDFDLAIQAGNLPDSNLHSTLIGYWYKKTCLSKEYALKYGIPKNPNDLIEHQCLIHYHNKKRSWRFKINNEIEDITPPCNISVSNSLDLLKMTVSGFGISYLPDFIVEQEIKSGKLISTLDDFMPPPLPMYVLFANKHPTSKEKIFIDFLKEIKITKN